MISNLNIRHTYLNIKINNQGKILACSDHWPLRATKLDTSILEIQTKAFLLKMILLESGDHCESANLNIRHTYLNIKINNQGKTQQVWSLTTESNKVRHQYTEHSNLSFSSKRILLQSGDHCGLQFKY